MTVSEVLALALASGPTTFVAGPLAIIVDLVAAGDLLEFYKYLVLSQGKMSGLIELGEVLFLQNKQNCTEPLFKLRASLRHWLYSSLVFASGLFVGMDEAQSLHNPETQLPNENAGFPMSQQLADLTLAEVKDLVPDKTPVLVPVYGPLGLLRYPTKPLSMTVQVATVSIGT